MCGCCSFGETCENIWNNNNDRDEADSDYETCTDDSYKDEDDNDDHEITEKHDDEIEDSDVTDDDIEDDIWF